MLQKNNIHLSTKCNVVAPCVRQSVPEVWRWRIIEERWLYVSGLSRSEVGFQRSMFCAIDRSILFCPQTRTSGMATGESLSAETAQIVAATGMQSNTDHNALLGASAPVSGAPPGAAPGPRVDNRLDALTALIDRLEPKRLAASASLASPLIENPNSASAAERRHENHLAQVRLGMANGLFAALQCRHAAAASHSVRVALGCSAWAIAEGLPDSTRNALEVAALLHDIGKLGVPDRVLFKPSRLSAEEHLLMDRHRQMGISILGGCCASNEVLEIVRHAPAWFDGTRMRIDRDGTQLPLGARMLAIVDAFDSMTMPQVYRPALSREQAVKELCDNAGAQFDPELVLHFASLQSSDQQKLHRRVASHWLQELDPDTSNSLWRLQSPSVPGAPLEADLFPQNLLSNMYDGVVFLDANLQVSLWNRGMERLSGILGASIIDRRFVPSILELKDESGRKIDDEHCPFTLAIHNAEHSIRRFTLHDRQNRELAVDIHTIPVLDSSGVCHGVALVVHDASGRASLEDRCQKLYEQATRDPLTQLANRAEFDRVHAVFVAVHMERQLTCSLVICDLDNFKQINDTYGHVAGDEVIKSFAQILKSACRPGDLVARYGGEEFVVLCADCNNAAAAERAEQIRRNFERLPQPDLGTKTCTASFGVTEIQPGDTPQTMLNRADRALLQAKESGRNIVVQLGTGMAAEKGERRRGRWLWNNPPAGALLEKDLLTNVPLNITLEKLRGFLADHQAQLTEIDGDRVEFLLPAGKHVLLRRLTDRPLVLLVEMEFSLERDLQKNVSRWGTQTLEQTRIHVVMRPKRGRDRRTSNAADRAPSHGQLTCLPHGH